MRQITFENLIAPVSVETFKRDYWEQKPLVISRKEPSYYRDLLSLADVDEVLSTSSVLHSNLRVVQQGRETSIRELLATEPGGATGGLEALFGRYRQGSTIVLNALHERSKTLAELCRSMAVELSAMVQVNVYLTPRTARGLQTHYDTHDVFVAQAEGSKHWRLFDAPVRVPLETQTYVAPDEGPGVPIREFDLEAGDLIYIPRGYVHDATSNDSASLHMTVGILPVTWDFVLRSAVESVIEHDSRFREALPPGFAAAEGLQADARRRFSELVGELAKSMSPEAAIENAVRKALLSRQPVLNGHLLDLEAEALVTMKTTVHRRSHAQFRMSRDESHVSLEFHGKRIRVPEYVEKDLHFMAETGDFKAEDLPGELDEAGRLLLIRTLLREGFLTVSLNSTEAQAVAPYSGVYSAPVATA